jgi:hypothetical protein
MDDDTPTGAFTLSGFCANKKVGKTFTYNEIKSGRLTAVKAGRKTLILGPEAARWERALPKLQTGKRG